MVVIQGRLMALVIGTGWDKYGVARKGRGWFGTVLVVQE